ncbi:hypothetical protein SAMN05444487_10435 [Marininema mesophilum]|uniref:Uncharacterized protein n=1 Tax=Marininema mesophilum TaxID=1048340 RepID=A0A1H2U8T9_9BACL|nr:hypothetical protein SAMN05444487_10435 [Marininema mesophilum]
MIVTLFCDLALESKHRVEYYGGVPVKGSADLLPSRIRFDEGE